MTVAITCTPKTRNSAYNHQVTDTRYSTHRRARSLNPERPFSMYVATMPPTLQKANPTIRPSGGPFVKEAWLILSTIHVAHGMPNETNKNTIIEALCRVGFVPVPSPIAPVVSVYAVTVVGELLGKNGSDLTTCKRLRPDRAFSAWLCSTAVSSPFHSNRLHGDWCARLVAGNFLENCVLFVYRGTTESIAIGWREPASGREFTRRSPVPFMAHFFRQLPADSEW